MRPLFLVFSILLLVSCSKTIDVKTPANEITEQDVFATEVNANSAVLGLYVRFIGGNLTIANAGLSVYASLYADDIVNTSATNAGNPFATNSIPSNNSTLHSSFWAPPYATIYHANRIIEGLDQSQLNFAFRNRLKAEACFIRAYMYFCLVNLFGEVPLVLISDYQVNTQLKRSPRELVYAQIIADLQFASENGHPGYTAGKRSRIDKWAAKALLARVFLFKGQWSEAASSATELINNTSYTLPSLSAVFLTSSIESILQLQPPGNAYYTFEGSNFIPSSSTVRPNYALLPGLLSAFETNDLRRSQWISSNTVSGTVYAYPHKYKVRTAGTSSVEEVILLRLAEQYLIRAEARAQSNDLTGASADINAVRQRAGLTASSAVTKDDILAAIAKERRTEFFAESGHRWFDLKRTNQASAILAPIKAGWQDTDTLFPIPLIELERSIFLTQNEGY